MFHGSSEVQVFVARVGVGRVGKEIEKDRKNRVSSAGTEQNPCRNMLVRAKSELSDTTAQKMIKARGGALQSEGLILRPIFSSGGLGWAASPEICLPPSRRDQTQDGKWEQESRTEHCPGVVPLWSLLVTFWNHSWSFKWICSPVRGVVE